MDPKGSEIKFAGYPIRSRFGSPIVICGVSTEALSLIGNLPNATKKELMGIFEIHKETIFKIASDMFDSGAHRPSVTSEDFQGTDA
jgi:hypothetical protein